MPDTHLQTNICIIGAGPAGATTSLFLSKMKIAHTIIDAATFPRDKVCGDALDLKVFRVLNELDKDLVEREIMQDDNFVKAWGASIITAKGKRYHLQIKNEQPNQYPFFFISKRSYFDNYLVGKFNPEYADFRQGAKVQKLERTGDCWQITARTATGELHITCNLVVGADGDHSAVLRSLGERKIDRRNYAGALRQYWRGIADMTPTNNLEIYLPPSLPLAYLWIFPLPNGEANVGCGLASDLIAKKSLDLKKLFKELITNDPALAYRFKDAEPLEKAIGWGLPLASQRRKASGDGYLLVGDAASLVCPTTGEGIGPGMFSGYIAAHFIARAVQNNKYDLSMFTNYDREINKRWEDDIKKYNFLKNVSPSLYNSLIQLASATGFAQKYFKKNVDKWIDTAKNKPIAIDY